MTTLVFSVFYEKVRSNKTNILLSLSKEVLLTLTVLNFLKFTSYCSLKPLWSGMGEVVPARTSPTLHPKSPPTVHQLSRLALCVFKGLSPSYVVMSLPDYSCQVITSVSGFLLFAGRGWRKSTCQLEEEVKSS